MAAKPRQAVKASIDAATFTHWSMPQLFIVVLL
ncbi:hypothetical protein STENM36S_07630 [Streptomyces tendae]